MRTSRDVYAQILWDSRLDPVHFTLMVDVHRTEPKVIRFEAFDPDGDIPWHRVLAIHCQGQPCWDRQGLDTLDQLANSGRFAPRLLGAPFWEARQPVRWSDGAWRPVAADAPEQREQLTLLTWNVLWDRFVPELLHSERRWPRVIDELLEADVDLVSLQEVTPGFHRMLLDDPRMRAQWWCSHAPGHDDLRQADVLLLGRCGVTEIGFCKLRPHKAAVGAVLAAGPVVVGTHLSSDHSRDAANRREEELRRIQLATDVGRGSIWIGDFNHEAPVLDTRDAWTLLHPPLPTFDPVSNPLAIHSSRTGRPVRIDRILLRGPYAPVKLERIGTEAVDGLHPSDHFGVRATVSLQPPRGLWLGEPSHRSALAWLPSDPTAVDTIRAQRDPGFERWPAHLNLLWPFVPEARFDEARDALETLQFAPFDARLTKRGRFSGRRPTAWLGPEDPSPWSSLIGELRRRFPTAGTTEHPHLTVARDEQPLPELTVEEPVHTLALLTRRGDGPFRIRATLDAAGTWTEQPPLSLEPVPAGPVPFDLPEPAVLVGSRAMGVALQGADVDLLWFGDPDDARAAFASHGSMRSVERAGLPGLVVHGTPRVDVILLPPDARTADPNTHPEAIQHALTAIHDIEALKRLPHPETFTDALRWVKCWARSQALHRAALGGLEGLAWAVLVAEVLEPDVEATLRRFFTHWASWDWTTGVGGEASHEVSIHTPAAPRRVITTRARRHLLEAALLEAWEMLDEGAPLDALLRPMPWHRRHDEAVWVRASTHEALGRAEGRALALIDALGPVVPVQLADGFALGLHRHHKPSEIDGVIADWVEPGIAASRTPTPLIPDPWEQW